MEQKPVVIMEDELVHEIQPDGSISWCRDASCPCRDQALLDCINLSARSVTETEPYEPTGISWYLSRPNQSEWLVE